MSATRIEVGEFLYELAVNFTGITEFGMPLPALLGGAAPHLAGSRYDIAFEGKLTGPRLSGSIRGTDYMEVRADGRMEINIRAAIVTADGESLAFGATGLLQPQADGSGLRLVESGTLKTASPLYAWVNEVLVWGVGRVDVQAGTVHVNVYAA